MPDLLPPGLTITTALEQMQGILGGSLVLGFFLMLAAVYVAEHAAMAVLRILNHAMNAGWEKSHPHEDSDGGIE